jgi:serine/threonine protein kinase
LRHAVPKTTASHAQFARCMALSNPGVHLRIFLPNSVLSTTRFSRTQMVCRSNLDAELWESPTKPLMSICSAPVALNIINARLFGDDSARLRFVREARAAASVRHPNVASVFYLGECGGNYFYAMEFVEGEALETLIRRSGSLETDLALEIMAQVSAGLTAIQKKHLVHRDIKPSNIMVEKFMGGAADELSDLN